MSPVEKNKQGDKKSSAMELFPKKRYVFLYFMVENDVKCLSQSDRWTSISDMKFEVRTKISLSSSCHPIFWIPFIQKNIMSIYLFSITLPVALYIGNVHLTGSKNPTR